MRRMACALLCIIAICVTPVSSRAAANAGVLHLAQNANCLDDLFLTDIETDLGQFDTLYKALDTAQPAEIAQDAVALITLRHKYEALTDIPEDCIDVQYKMIFLLANTSDLANVRLLASLEKGDYTKQLADQHQRVEDHLDALVTLLQAAKNTPN